MARKIRAQLWVWLDDPAFDLNPSVKKEEHVLALDMHSRRPDMDVVMETAGLYRLNQAQAREIVQNVGDVVGSWPLRARKMGISRQECFAREHLFKVGT